MNLAGMIRALVLSEDKTVTLKDGTKATFVGNKDGASVLVRRPGKNTVESVFVGNIEEVKDEGEGNGLKLF